MVSQPELYRRFIRGVEPDAAPTASNVSVQAVEDEDEYDAAIVGYGWAAYALRRTDGSIEYCEGWEGYSAATSTQMGKLRRVLNEEGAEWETVVHQPEYGRGIEWRRGKGDMTVR